MAEEMSTERRSKTAADSIEQLENDFAADAPKFAVPLAEAYLTAGRPHDALDTLRKKGVDTSAFDTTLLLAQIQFDLAQNKAARDHLKEAENKGSISKNLRAQLLMGELEFEDGNTENAKRYLHEVLKIDADNKRAALLLHNLGEDIDVDDPMASSFEHEIGFSTEVGAHKETAKTAMTQVLVGLLAGGLLLGGYLWHAYRTNAAKALVIEAIPLIDSADTASLKSAVGMLDEALDIHGGNQYAKAGAALAHTMLWYIHGLVDSQGDSIAWVDEAVDDNIERGDRYAAEAMVALAEGRIPEAEEIAAEVIERGGVSEKVYWVLGIAQRSLGKHKVGRDNLRRAQESSTGSPHFAVSLGDAYDADNDPRNAKLFWTLALKANSNFVPAVARDLLARVRRGEDAAQLETELKALAERPADDLGPKDLAAISHTQAALFYRTGKTAEALAEVQKAIDLGGESPMLLGLKGRALLAEKKVDEGLAARKAAYEASHSAQRYFYELARDYSDHGKFKEALELMKSKEGDLSQDASYHVAYGNVHLAKGDFKDAKAAYDSALKINDRHADALLQQGVLDVKQRNFDSAVKWFEKAVGVRSRFPEVFEAVGLMRVAQGEFGDADTQFQEAEKMFRAMGASAQRMQEFYVAAIKGFMTSSRARSYVSSWVAREKAYRQGS